LGIGSKLFSYAVKIKNFKKIWQFNTIFTLFKTRF